MDVLLVQPPFEKPRRLPRTDCGELPPLMLLYLAKPLLDSGFNVSILDRTVHKAHREQFRAYISTCRPRIVGISTTTENFSTALTTAHDVKLAHPAASVVIGGPHVTFEANSTLEHPCFDFVVRGEGELPFFQLVAHLVSNRYSLQHIGGLSYRHEGAVVHTGRLPPQNIETLTPASRTLIDCSRYMIPGTLLTSRGCPFNCRFCAATALSGGSFRLQHVDTTKKELDYLIATLGIADLAFIDDSFTAFPDRTEQICHHILRKGYEVSWLCESRVDVVSRKLVRLMRQAGCHCIHLGFESGNQQVLDSIGKGITIGQIENAVQMCVDNGITATGNFVIGFPDDTAGTIRDTFELAVKLRRMGAFSELAVLTPFPGTYYHRHARELGLVIHSRDWEDYALENPIISTKNLTVDQLALLYREMRMELRSWYPGDITLSSPRQT